MNEPSSLPTLILATRNRRKLDEIRAILGEGFRYLTLNDFSGAPRVVEDSGTFAGNATKKAVELARWLAGTQHSKFNTQNCLVIADDSGLEVDALKGGPGVHSARFAALDTGAPGNSSDAENNTKLLRLLTNVPTEKRTARFRCVIALVPIEGRESNVEVGNPQLFEGVCEGRIGSAPRGQGGFGYDPLFIPDGYEQTFAELGEASNNQLSHRARALAKLKLRFDADLAVSQ
jgi:XTP/dITP diphosphohydrolase